MSVHKASRVIFGLAILVFFAAPTLGEGIIYNGIDSWRTLGKGSSFIDFDDDPIPAGFFCGGSEPFTGRIAWEGAPLVTSPADALGGADTVVRRLDNAVFDREGVATVRLQMAALSLGGTVKTSCGIFKVRATLAPGVQPMTEMRIVRTEKGGGSYEAPLSFIARLTFTRPLGKGERLEIDRPVSFQAAPGAIWTAKPKNPGKKVGGFVLVDTDGDGQTDTFLPGTSNFFPAGRADVQSKNVECDASAEEFELFDDPICHDSGYGNQKCHCVESTSEL